MTTTVAMMMRRARELTTPMIMSDTDPSPALSSEAKLLVEGAWGLSSVKDISGRMVETLFWSGSDDDDNDDDDDDDDDLLLLPLQIATIIILIILLVSCVVRVFPCHRS